MSLKYRWRFGWLLVLVAAVIFYQTGYAASECNSRCCDEEYPKLIVQGQGKIEVLADKAYFNIKMRIEEKRLERAFEESTKRINSIQQVLVSMGVKKEDIRNLGYSYSPLYEGKKIFTTIDRPTSYEVVHTLKVTIYELENLGKILAGISEINETTIYGLSYTSTKIEEIKREVLKEAASDARQKAVKLAEGSGAILGKVIKIESASYERPLQAMAFAEAMPRMAYKAEAAAPPQVESGYIEVTGGCTVSYSIQ